MPQIHKTIPLLWTFYKSYCFLSALITFFCVRAFWIYGFTGFAGIFWFKILTLVVTFFFVNQTKKKEYYYYQNLGIGKTLLWTATLSFDCIVFAILLILTNQYSWSMYWKRMGFNWNSMEEKYCPIFISNVTQVRSLGYWAEMGKANPVWWILSMVVWFVRNLFDLITYL